MHRTLATVTALLLAVAIAACDKPQDAGGKPEQKGKKEVKETKAPEGTEQTTCPVMGGKIVKTSFADHDGKRVYFCCAGCDATFKKDPEKYIKQMEDKGIILAKTPAEKK